MHCICNRDFHNTFLVERIGTTWNHEVDSSQERANQQYTWCNFINFVFIECCCMIDFVLLQVFSQSLNIFVLHELDALLGQHNPSFSIDPEVKCGSTSCSTTTATAQRIGLKATCIWVPFGLILPRTGGATCSHPTKISNQIWGSAGIDNIPRKETTRTEQGAQRWNHILHETPWLQIWGQGSYAKNILHTAHGFKLLFCLEWCVGNHLNYKIYVVVKQHVTAKRTH